MVMTQQRKDPSWELFVENRVKNASKLQVAWPQQK